MTLKGRVRGSCQVLIRAFSLKKRRGRRVHIVNDIHEYDLTANEDSLISGEPHPVDQLETKVVSPTSTRADNLPIDEDTLPGNGKHNTPAHPLRNPNNKGFESADNEEIVTLLVGSAEGDEKPTRLKAHKSVLVAQSSFFAARYKREWEDARKSSDQEFHSTEIHLPDLPLWALTTILHYFYTGRLPSTVPDPSDPKKTTQLWVRVPELYHTADILLMTSFQNHLVDLDLADHRDHRNVWKLASIEEFHDFELTHTPYYQLFLDSMVGELCRTPLNELNFKERMRWMGEKDWGADAMRDVLERMNRWHLRPWAMVGEGNWCRYHIHEKGQRCR